MEIRKIQEADREESYYLNAQAFLNGLKDTSRYKDPTRMGDVSYGVWDENGLQAKVAVIDFKVHLGPDVVVPMGGIAGVVSLPASRGKGYAGACMKYTLRQMKENGYLISGLYPFSFDYYRRLGWEWCGIKRYYSMPTRIFKPSPDTEFVRKAEIDDRQKIIGCYTKFSGRYRGALVRPDKYWNKILENSGTHFTYTYLYEKDSVVEGYLTYREGKQEKTWLREFVALTPQAYAGMLGLLRRHEMQIEKFSWDAPGDDTLWSQIYHWDIETKIEPAFMGRIVDIPTSLSAWKPAAGSSGSFSIEVRDEYAPWNQGKWRIEFENGVAHCAVSHAKPDISLDIQALSQAYFGTPTVPEIRAAGQLTVHSESGYQAMVDYFSGPPMWTNDGF